MGGLKGQLSRGHQDERCTSHTVSRRELDRDPSRPRLMYLPVTVFHASDAARGSAYRASTQRCSVRQIDAGRKQRSQGRVSAKAITQARYRCAGSCSQERQGPSRQRVQVGTTHRTQRKPSEKRDVSHVYSGTRGDGRANAVSVCVAPVRDCARALPRAPHLECG